MAQYGSNQVGFILVGGYDVLGVVTEIAHDVEGILENNHALGDAWFKSYPVGLSKFILMQKGFYDDAAAGAVTELVSGTGIGRVVCVGLEGNTIGLQFCGFQAPVQAKQTRLPAIGALTKLDAEFRANGAMEEGVILHAHGTETASSGDTSATPVDADNEKHRTLIPITSATKANPCVVTTTVPHGLTSAQVAMIATNTLAGPAINGAQIVTVLSPTTFSVPVDTSGSSGAGTGGTVKALSTLNGGAAYIETSALTLGDRTNFAPLVKHSTDNVTYTTLATFTVQTAAPAAERVAVAAGTTVKRYLDMTWSWTGGTTGQSVKFMVGFARSL